MSDSEVLVYVVVSNIPSFYHSSDLRNYFSQFIETSGFKCFHFRHRPQIREFAVNDNLSSNVTLNTTCSSTHLLDSKSKTCCIVQLKLSRIQEFFDKYNKKHWMDKNGDSLPLKCIINSVKVNTTLLQSKQLSFKTRAELRDISSHGCKLEVSAEELQKFQELHPPPAMPNGNVGTPTKIFLELIRTCRLPSKIIGKLGLEFPRSKAKRLYGSVPFDYGEQYTYSFTPEDEEVVRSASGVILSENMTTNISLKVESNNYNVEETENSSSDDDDDFCEEWERHEALHNDVTEQERCKERLFEEEIELKWEKGGSGLVFYTDAQYWDELEGDFDAKTSDDWDVDMSIYYDSNAGDKDARDMMQMRKEKKLRSDVCDLSKFKETCLTESSNNRNTTQKHQEMQASTFEPKAVFNDEMLSIAKKCRKDLKRKGISENNESLLRCGGFEHHTKGIGRRVLERQGWKEGQGLGKSISGISEPIEDWGQRPWDKKGLGFRGEKLVRRVREKKRPGRRKEHIGTIYDDPQMTDPPVPVSRSDFHTRLSYRQVFLKAKSN